MSGVASAFARAAAGEPQREREPARWVRDDRGPALLTGMIWVLVVLMIVPEGFDYASLSTAESPSSGGPLSRMLWLGLLGLSVGVILRRAGLAGRILRWVNPFLLAFIVLAVASIGWSIEPSVTLRRMIRVFTIAAAALAFVLMGWHALRFQNVLRPVFTAVLFGSLIFGLGWPQLASHQFGSDDLIGAWRGLTNHKNSLGDIACIGLIFWVHAWLSKEVRSGLALAGGGVAAACLLLSQSTTSLIATVFTLMFLLLLMRAPRTLRPYLPYLVSAFTVALLVYSLAVLDVVPGLDLLLKPIGVVTGKDASFTGRTQIWDIISEHIRLHPFLGSGYAAYWTGPQPGSPSYAFVQQMQFYPGSAHSGYLEILNDLGALGLLVLFGYLAVYAAQALRLLRVERGQAALYLALFIQQVLTNLSESRWFSVLSVDFVIMTMASTALARALFEHRLREYLGQPRDTAAGRSGPQAAVT